MDANWIDAFADDELTADAPRVLKTDGKRIAVFRSEGGEVFAVDDRCPHEGYPLAKGDLADCVLTCKWHNFKFNVRDGACLMGDEAVRTFPIRLRGRRLEIDVADPHPALAAAKIWPSLERGLLERKIGQVARDVVRLLALGIEPARLAMFAALFDARYCEWGSTHVLPLALDVLDEAERRGSIERTSAALPLMQVFELAADAHTRRARRTTRAAIDPGEDPIAAGEQVAAAIEAEDLDRAIGLVRGAVARGWRRKEIEPWLFAPLCAHFLGFGHAMIYQVKVFDLLERCGWDETGDLLAAHVLGIATMTREDTLPEWSHFIAARKALTPRAAELIERGRASINHDAPQSLVDQLTDGDRSAALEGLVNALDGGLSLRGVVNALVLAASERIVRFDERHDRSAENQHDWLDVTHTLTYASALREAIVRTNQPEMLHALLFGARFVNSTKALDRRPTERVSIDAAGARSWPAVFELAANHDARAVTMASGLLAAGDDTKAASEAWRFVLDDPCTRPIVSAHLIKLLVATLRERHVIGSDAPLLATIRVAAANMRERRVGRATHEAIRLIVDGKVPRTLY